MLQLNGIDLPSQLKVILESYDVKSKLTSMPGLHDYDLHSKYSNSAAGGVAIYIRSNLDYIIRDDLSIVEDEFETLWAEIKKQTTECPVLLCL